MPEKLKLYISRKFYFCRQSIAARGQTLGMPHCIVKRCHSTRFALAGDFHVVAVSVRKDACSCFFHAFRMFAVKDSCNSIIDAFRMFAVNEHVIIRRRKHLQNPGTNSGYDLTVRTRD